MEEHLKHAVEELNRVEMAIQAVYFGSAVDGAFAHDRNGQRFEMLPNPFMALDGLRSALYKAIAAGRQG